MRRTGAHRRYQPGTNFGAAARNVSIPTPVAPSNCTVCLWVFPTTLSANWVTCSIDNGTNGMFINPNVTANMNLFVDASNISASAATIVVNVWRFVCMTANGSNLSTLFTRTVQGAFTSASLALVSSVTTISGSNLSINKNGVGDAGLIGTYAGIKVFDRGMSQAEVIRESQQLAPLSSGCVAYLPMRWSFERAAFDEATGKTWTTTGALTKSIPALPLPIPELSKPKFQSWIYVNTSGGVARAMASAIVGQATVVDAIIVARAMVDAIVGTSVVVDNLKVARGMTDAIVGSATVVDNLKVARGMIDAVAGQATVTDAMKVARGMVDSVGGQAHVTDAVIVARAMADAIGASAHVTDALSAARPLSDAVLGTSVLTDSLAVNRALVEGVHGQAFMLAALAGSLTDLAVAISAHATLVDPLSILRTLQDVIAGHASVTNAITHTIGLAVTIQAVALLTEQVTIARAMGLQVHAHALVAMALTSKLPPTVFPVPYPQAVMLPFTI